MEQYIEISQYTVGADFSKYSNKNIIKIDQLTALKNGVGARPNYLYTNNKKGAFSFLGRPIKKVAFEVKDKKIREVILFFEVFDADSFYHDLLKKYGDPETARISSLYLKRHGYHTPQELDSLKGTEYDNLPPPSINDYKYLNGIAWYDLDSNLDKSKYETSLYVRNTIDNSTPNSTIYMITVNFRIRKLE